MTGEESVAERGCVNSLAGKDCVVTSVKLAPGNNSSSSKLSCSLSPTFAPLEVSESLSEGSMMPFAAVARKVQKC